MACRPGIRVGPYKLADTRLELLILRKYTRHGSGKKYGALAVKYICRRLITPDIKHVDSLVVSDSC